ncbi:peptidase domain-containing ABC transporter [Candidatus Odyssella thessalonicensis]|uniref:peptidase domain-containing ABC transporter n=1 Tax=Candidatus Odyssella thessalonicensis TaxID=84647 RepID=UPI000225A911|nr:ATP-binding cassette domain-containing protein [Candidatus Odyssella thessalonicensis]
MTTFNYINCLKPLLRCLGWQGDSRRIFEAVPYEVKAIDLIDLKNIFVSLGYSCYSKHSGLAEIKRSFLPTLFINESKQIYWVIYERTEKDFLYIDCRTGQKSAVPIRKRLKGIRYNFVKDTPALGIAEASWSKQLMKRFKHELWLPVIISTFCSFWFALVPLFFLFVNQYLLQKQSQETLMYFSTGIILFLLSLLAFSHFKGRRLAYLAARIKVIINTELLRHLLKVPFANTKGLELTTQLDKLKCYDENHADLWISATVALMDLPLLIFSLLFLGLHGGQLVFVPCGVIGIQLLSVRYFLSTTKDLQAQVHAAQEITNDFLTETVTNQQSISNLAATPPWKERYCAYLSQASGYDKEWEQLQARFANWQLWLLKSSATLTLIWAMHLINQGKLPQALFLPVTLWLWQIGTAIYRLGGLFIQWPALKKTLTDIDNIMSHVPEGDAAVHGQPRFQGHITVKDLHFRYPGQTHMALQGITMDIKPGEIIAIIGQNASGKSTLVNLLMRLYDPLDGEIRIDGVNIQNFDPLSYRQSIGFAPSTPQLFEGSIAQNIRLANPEATEQEILEVLSQVGLKEVVQQLPDGIYTHLYGNNDQRFSPSFLQQLNLARALIRDSNILILDEPTGHIDFKTDAIFKNTLQTIRGKKTIIIVTHRPSIINFADRILVLNKGKMRLFGSKNYFLNILSGNAA